MGVHQDTAINLGNIYHPCTVEKPPTHTCKVSEIKLRLGVLLEEAALGRAVCWVSEEVCAELDEDRVPAEETVACVSGHA